MIAKATAKEARTRFINLDVSILTDKWYGESQKLTSAVFSLAVKIQPCIIFIDEIGKQFQILNLRVYDLFNVRIQFSNIDLFLLLQIRF